MRVVGVLVTYNRLSVLLDTIEKLSRQSVKVNHLIVVDNNSSDGTEAYFELNKVASISYHHLNQNIGFGGALAEGMQYARKHFDFDYYWLMDDDSQPAADVLEKLLQKIIYGQYGIAGVEGYRYSYFSKKRLITDQQNTEIILIDNALVCKKAADVTGYPRASYFMMCEDYEYCLRLRMNGFTIGLVPDLNVERLHLGSERFSHSSLWRGYYHARNHLLILKEYFSFRGLVYYVVTQIKYLAASLFAKDRFQRIYYRLTGIVHGIAGRKGKSLDPASLKFITTTIRRN